MKIRNYTIGMAGHIDHGKTALTKALTKKDTDRLKEEQERKISIELGFAPLKLKDTDTHVSIVDVPGHERFIRQMIAGVAGIDLVIITVAADEGIMPQTKEHIDILSLLDIKQAMIVITKIDKVDRELLELVKDDVQQFFQGSYFSQSPIIFVDSLSGKGISELKERIEVQLKNTPSRKSHRPFRMPVDQVFTMKGIGSVVRGTIYEGTIEKGDRFFVLPGQAKEAKARQIQVHNQEVEEAFAGQRTAINISGVSREDLSRGDVLVKNPMYFEESDTIDLSLQLLEDINYPVKQRAPIKFHSGANEVYGKIVFFDRNEVKQAKEEILCQVRLQEPIVINRGDRFILRRATPVETLGGGWVINPDGEKYRFGNETIQKLQQLKESTPESLVLQLLQEEKWVEHADLMRRLSLSQTTLDHILHEQMKKGQVVQIEGYYSTSDIIKELKTRLYSKLSAFHEDYPLKEGVNKPELLQSDDTPDNVFEKLLNQWISDKELKQYQQYISLYSFSPAMPPEWKKRMENVIHHIFEDHILVKEWITYLEKEGIPEELHEDFRKFLISQKIVYPLTDKHLIHSRTLNVQARKLSKNTDEYFTLKEAKKVWDISRKYLIPLLELMDALRFTERVDGDRKWICRPN
ncbi:selenocysteine-specific translation elongation factor [Virgibacillus sp. MSP4-1]|uniref:selenocysteine-specific translation elongation factor n=1 Tax=Virgibacillus sp. MSP4-1 TaxID=2700081 RepID=UPI0003A129A2|nr:selenocysteine-specific translation elongation factor [Virgibacillus sp. MSP4-1]QHS22351.1 selenocysteine-specific translation elongation factor [Virgibacillus sp. MSP4-1]